jgi:hypothetical protein
MPRPFQSSRFDHPNNFGWGVQIIKHLLFSFLHSPFTQFLWGPNILLSTLFSNTFGLSSSLNISDQVLHPYKTTGKIKDLYIFILVFLDSSLKYKKIMNRMITNIPWLQSVLNFFLSIILIF